MRGSCFAVVLVALVVCASAASPQDPFVGSWKLSRAKSDYPSGNHTFRQLADGQWQWVSLGGTVTYTFRMDGVAAPQPGGVTIAWKQIDATTWESVWTKDGRWMTSRWQLSPDGQILTCDEQFEERHRKDTYDRVGGSAGLAGTWKADLTQGRNFMLDIVANGDDGWTVTDRFDQDTWVCKAKLDGKGYLRVGPKGDADQTHAFRRTGPRSVEITQRYVAWPADEKGIVIDLTVSEDGKTLTRVFGDHKWVYDRQ